MKTSPSKLLKLKRQQRALELRLAGRKLSEISAAIGVSLSRTQALIQEAMTDSRQQIRDSADDLRAEEIARLNLMLGKVFPRAVRGELIAVDRVLKIGERRAKLLGLDAPVRTALQGGGDDAPPVVTEARVAIYIPDNGRGSG